MIYSGDTMNAIIKEAKDKASKRKPLYPKFVGIFLYNDSLIMKTYKKIKIFNLKSYIRKTNVKEYNKIYI